GEETILGCWRRSERVDHLLFHGIVTATRTRNVPADGQANASARKRIIRCKMPRKNVTQGGNQFVGCSTRQSNRPGLEFRELIDECASGRPLRRTLPGEFHRTPIELPK